MDVDDIFDQTDSATFEQEFSNRQYDKYVSKFYNEGYREALSDLEDKASTETSESENNVLQTAFDKGYNSAFLVSKKLATLSASVKTHLMIYKNILIDISFLLDVQADLPETSPFFVCPNGFGLP